MKIKCLILIGILAAYPFGAYCQPSSSGNKRLWDKDPFAPPASVDLKIQEKEEGPAVEVSAILYSGEHSSAVINGNTLHIGDEFQGQKILDIKRTYVILGNGKKSYRLELKK